MLFTEGKKKIYRRCIKIIFSLLPDTQSSPRTQCLRFRQVRLQGFLNLCVGLVASRKLLHQHITMKKKNIIYLRVKINCIIHVPIDKLDESNIFFKKPQAVS